MLRWLLVLMFLAAVWTAPVHGASDSVSLEDAGSSVSRLGVSTGSLVLPVSGQGRIAGWLFKNSENVPRPAVSERTGVLSGSLVFRSLKPSSNSFMSSAWMGLAVFGGLVVVLGAAAWWHKPI